MIASAHNQYIRYAASLRDKKARDAAGAFVAEGRRFVDEAPVGWGVEMVLISESFAAKHDCARYAALGDCFVASDAAFQKASGTETPQGILAVCRKQENFGGIQAIIERRTRKEEGGQNPLLLMLDCVADPGNVGTLLRAADAAGADGMILSEGCADVYGDKALRAAAGSIFHLPVMAGADLPAMIRQCQAAGARCYGASLRGAGYPYGLPLGEPCGLVIGSEARGLCAGVANACDALVKLPMLGRAESLNAAVAGGVLLYEAARQRCALRGSNDRR